jgi:acyl-CoA reductase-like NAD-dependent aldehyde dehydrogenase
MFKKLTDWLFPYTSSPQDERIKLLQKHRDLIEERNDTIVAYAKLNNKHIELMHEHYDLKMEHIDLQFEYIKLSEELGSMK